MKKFMLLFGFLLTTCGGGGFEPKFSPGRQLDNAIELQGSWHNKS